MQSSDGPVLGLPRPGKALIGLMVVVTALWLMFAVGLNWGGASSSVFMLLTGNTQAILHGEVWRLLTAPLMHWPSGGSGVSHLLTALFGLYFLAPRLEELWGVARTLRFIGLACVLAYVLQMLVQLALPDKLALLQQEPSYLLCVPIRGHELAVTVHPRLLRFRRQLSVVDVLARIGALDPSTACGPGLLDSSCRGPTR